MNTEDEDQPLTLMDKIRIIMILILILGYMWVDGTMTVLP